MTFEGKIVWITGASSGIGEALAYELAARGARLILSARRADRLHAVRAARARPAEHLVLPLDLEVPETLAEAARQALARLGAVDVLINNGGVSQRGRVHETDLSVYRRIMEVNYFGAVALTKAVLPAMLARGAGHIVVVSSVAGKISTPLRSAYAASKHALHGFFDALRAEVTGAGLRVTLVCPGFIATPIAANALTGEGRPQGAHPRERTKRMPVDVFVRKMVRSLERERDEVYIGKEKAGIYVRRFAPGLFNWLIRRVRVT